MGRRSPVKRVLVIGLDCAAPRFVFGPEPFDLPQIRALMGRGCWGRLRSCDPPITVPAWSCMMSGRDPGVLGLYGFRNRRDRSYGAMSIATSAAVRERRVWDILSDAGREVVLVGVPQTYPVQPVRGALVAGLLTPDTGAEFTYPGALKAELARNVGEYIIDLRDFRNNDREGLLKQVRALMENRFEVSRYLMESKPWDFFMMVEMGLDRLQHGFLRFADPSHPLYERGHPYAHAIRDYYEAVDERIGDLVSRAGEETAVLVVSDHGARALHGGLCINQWLMEEGYLFLEEGPHAVTPFEECRVDWPKTRAWGSGGYYGRIYLNVEGREAQGAVGANEYDAFRDELAGRLRAMKGPEGRPLGNRVLKPEEIYAEVNGVAPDLLVYFGDLDWRSVGGLGYESVYTFGNDTGPDDANHDMEGIFVMDDRAGRGGGELQGLQLMDVAPTILSLFGMELPPAMQGRAI